MVTILQATIIAKNPKHYHTENLKYSLGLLHHKPELTEAIKAELFYRAEHMFRDIIREYPELLLKVK